ncbi:MAG: amidohydrolase family protein, partial [Pseudomonadota bacterium]
HWHDTADYRFAPRPDLADDPVFRANIARLADYDFVFDLQVFAGQMAGAARLAADCPKTTFVLQHAGMLETDDDAGRAAWREGMARLAAQPNVVAKLSGLGTFIRRLDAEWIKAVASETLALFGAARCLWGSNFPIEKLWCGYADLVAAHRAAIPPPDWASIFETVAARVYRIA